MIGQTEEVGGSQPVCLWASSFSFFHGQPPLTPPHRLGWPVFRGERQSRAVWIGL